MEKGRWEGGRRKAVQNREDRNHNIHDQLTTRGGERGKRHLPNHHQNPPRLNLGRALPRSGFNIKTLRKHLIQSEV